MSDSFDLLSFESVATPCPYTTSINQSFDFQIPSKHPKISGPIADQLSDCQFLLLYGGGSEGQQGHALQGWIQSHATQVLTSEKNHPELVFLSAII